MAQSSNGLRVRIKFTSEGTYCSTAVATVAQQIQSNTITERTRVMVKIHPELLEKKKNSTVLLKLHNIKNRTFLTIKGNQFCILSLIIQNFIIIIWTHICFHQNFNFDLKHLPNHSFSSKSTTVCSFLSLKIFQIF